MRFFFTLFTALLGVFNTAYGLMIGGLLVISLAAHIIFQIIKS